MTFLFLPHAPCKLKILSYLLAAPRVSQIRGLVTRCCQRRKVHPQLKCFAEEYPMGGRIQPFGTPRCSPYPDVASVSSRKAITLQSTVPVFWGK